MTPTASLLIALCTCALPAPAHSAPSHRVTATKLPASYMLSLELVNNHPPYDHYWLLQGTNGGMETNKHYPTITSRRLQAWLSRQPKGIQITLLMQHLEFEKPAKLHQFYQFCTHKQIHLVGLQPPLPPHIVHQKRNPTGVGPSIPPNTPPKSSPLPPAHCAAPACPSLELPTAVQIIKKHGQLAFTDGSSYYVSSKNGAFQSGPMGLSGRTITGHWTGEDDVLTVTGRWGWINGVNYPNDIRRMTLQVQPDGQPPYKTKLPRLEVSPIPTTMYHCYVVVDELTPLTHPPSFPPFRTQTSRPLSFPPFRKHTKNQHLKLLHQTSRHLEAPC